MKAMTILGLMGALLLTATATADEKSALASEVEVGARKALAAMATRQWSGGWGNGWTVDGRIVLGEHNDIPQLGLTIQPPATPDTAIAFVRAAKVLDDPGLLHHGSLAFQALLAIRTPEGGFPHEGRPTGRNSTNGTFDDDTTTGALRFLIAYAQAVNTSEAWDAVKATGEFILAAQYDNGGWPQVYPLRPGAYSRHITFNDGVMANAIKMCLRLHEVLGDERYYKAAIRAGDCILKLQGGEGEEIWAQQHDAETLAPAPARAFEPAAYTASESRGVIDMLVELYLATGKERFLEPLPKAFAWYQAKQLPNGLWARFYEPGTGTPVYGDRDGKVYYSVDEISEERQRGYGWEGNYYPSNAEKRYARIQDEGREAILAQRAEAAKPDSAELAEAARQALEQLSPEGWWAEKASGRIRNLLEDRDVPEAARQVVWSRTFVANMNTLLDYLEHEPAR